jgi:hypothetical protein
MDLYDVPKYVDETVSVPGAVLQIEAVGLPRMTQIQEVEQRGAGTSLRSAPDLGR